MFKSDRQRRAAFANMMSCEPKFARSFISGRAARELEMIMNEAGKNGSTKCDGGVSLGSYCNPDRAKVHLEDGMVVYTDFTPKKSAEFSKGRAPKIGEIVYLPSDPDAGIFGTEGRVVGVNKSSADIQFGFGKDAVVEELGFEEFEDQESLRAKKEIEEKLFKEWEEETGNIKG